MKIFVKGNFFTYIDSNNLVWIDNCENAIVYKNSVSSTNYNILLKSSNTRFTDIPFSSINDETNTPYASQSIFEEYIYQNTGVRFQQPLIALDDLNDVVISAPSNGQVIEYNSTSGKWENVSPSGLGGDMTQAVYDTDGDGVVDSSERLEFIGKNSTGVTIAKTKVVYISGATGQKPNITLADASTEITSSKTIGITKTFIANNADGYVITHGTIHDVNTSAFSDGNALWLSETAGEITNTIPAEPAHSVFIGYVAYAHPTAGKIILHIQNGYELNELHGVSVTSEANQDVLRYETSTGLWKNQQLETATASQKGLLSSTDWSTFNNKQNTITLTTSGTSGASTLIGNTLNIPQYGTVFIPNLTGTETFRGVNYSNNSTTEVTNGGVVMSTSASGLARSISTTNYASKIVRKGFIALSVSTGRYSGTRGSALLWYIGSGFRYVCDFYISDTAYGSGCRQFYGLAGQTTDLGYSDTILVNSLINCIGVGSDSADSNLQIFYNDATGTCSKIDLGANFPSNRTSGAALTTMYSVIIYNGQNSSNVLVQVTNKETGVVSQNTLTSDIPLTTQGLNFFASRSMGGPITNTGQFDLAILGVYSI